MIQRRSGSASAAVAGVAPPSCGNSEGGRVTAHSGMMGAAPGRPANTQSHMFALTMLSMQEPSDAPGGSTGIGLASSKIVSRQAPMARSLYLWARHDASPHSEGHMHGRA